MHYRTRRIVLFCVALVIVVFGLWQSGNLQLPQAEPPTPMRTTPKSGESTPVASSALVALDTLPVKGRAPKTDYKRTQFGNGWALRDGCDMRNLILQRDLASPVVGEDCKVIRGTLNDPYTGKVIEFARGADTSDDVQIDHVVALSNAWQTGAQQLTPDQRIALANDPLELVAVDGPTNQAKGDGDAATWLPPNKAFRCQYVARQIAVKQRYALWVTTSEKEAMQRVLANCPDQQLPSTEK
ncbi:MAG: HNH endonuclease family protein [Candidatus Saccharimonas sp.]